ncbi:MAG TPA: Mur ligase family protein [Rhodospirillales bacterium]|nr:Mur ligase family protein [Rhodospirillales bacterium]
MIDVFPFAGYPVALYGLDEVGLFTARALFAGEAELSAWDGSSDNRAQAEVAGISPKDFSSNDLREFTTLIISAHAWKNDNLAKALATRAREQNVEVICDVELLARTQRESAYVGISGTYGKSLTAALVTYLLQVTGREAEMAGLSGTSALNTNPLGTEGVYVVEMTPFRVAHTVSITFDVAVLLNMDDDGASQAAMQIFCRQTDPRAAVISIDDKTSQTIFNKLSKIGEQRVYPFSIRQPVAGGVFVKGGTLYDSFDEGEPILVMDLSAISQFAGPHAQANVAAAFATVRAIGVQPHAAMAAINSFPGLVDHREEIGKIDGVLYINDAASSSLECAASSFCGYQNIHWVAGGDGAGDIAGIPSLKAVSQRLKAGYLFGELGRALLDAMEGNYPVSHFASLEQALEAARHEALTEDGPATVIYAPGCPLQSGEAFRILVEALPGERDDEN